MADDGLFFRRVGWLHPQTRVPVVAIALQGVWAMVIALSGSYEKILSYVISLDFLFFGLTATCLFALRRRDAAQNPSTSSAFRVPGHPFTTIAFVAASWLVVLNTFYKYWESARFGLLFLLSGIPAYFYWSRRKSR
jgi:APA family basic amino acid/polyamine antiporter